MPIMQTVCRYMKEENWTHSVDEAKGMVFCYVAGEHGTLSCMLVIDEKMQCLSIYTHMGVVVPSIKRLRMADFIARANYALLLGCFELDVDSGELHFRLSLPLAESELSRQQLRDLISTDIYMVDCYYPGIMMLIYQNATAAESIRACEG